MFKKKRIRILLLFVALLVLAVWYHRGIFESGKIGAVAQVSWIAGNPVDGIKNSRAIPRSVVSLSTNTSVRAKSRVVLESGKNNVEVKTPNIDDKQAQIPSLDMVQPRTFSILNTSREDAETQARALYDELDRRSDADIIAEARYIAPGYIDNTDEDMRDMVESLNLDPVISDKLKRYRATMTLAAYYLERDDASYGALSVAGWEIENRFHEFLKENLDENQFQRMLGIAKWQLRDMPHPYDDVEGLYWPQSEVFGELEIDKGIASEDELFSRVSYEKLKEVMDDKKQFEKTRKELLIQSNGEEISEDDFVRLMDSALDGLYSQIREVLSPEEAATIGYSDVYEESNTQDN